MRLKGLLVKLVGGVLSVASGLAIASEELAVWLSDWLVGWFSL